MYARDWTFHKYLEILLAAKEAGYQFQTINEFIENPKTPSIILRHDIDRQPNNAIKMAEIEKSFGVKSTYYIRMMPHVYRPEIVTKLTDLGHETGYHYETLAKGNGDIKKACSIFKTELETLRNYAKITTAAAHGRPLSRWNNSDIWQHFTPSDFGLIGEAYQSIDYSKVAYFTDTGRSWNADKTNLRDRTESNRGIPELPRTTDDLINIIKSRKLEQICIQTHPERWNDSPLAWLRSSFFDLSSNTAKLAIRSLKRST